MNRRRRVLLALAGTEDPTLVEHLATWLVPGSPGDLDVLLLHVVDDGPRGLIQHGPPIHRTPWPAPRGSKVDEQLEAADAEGTAALLAVWAERCAATLSGAGIMQHVRHGRPEREIVAAADELGADLIVVQARTRPGPMDPGPRSVGHVARFVLDHAPVPVLLVRGRASGSQAQPGKS